MNDATSRIIIDDMAARTTEAGDYLTTITPDLMRRGLYVQTRGRGGDPVIEIPAAEAVLRQGEYPVFVMCVTAGAHTEPGGEVLKAVSSGS